MLTSHYINQNYNSAGFQGEFLVELDGTAIRRSSVQFTGDNIEQQKADYEAAAMNDVEADLASHLQPIRTGFKAQIDTLVDSLLARLDQKDLVGFFNSVPDGPQRIESAKQEVLDALQTVGETILARLPDKVTE